MNAMSTIIEKGTNGKGKEKGFKEKGFKERRGSKRERVQREKGLKEYVEPKCPLSGDFPPNFWFLTQNYKFLL